MAEGLSVALPLEVNPNDGAYGAHKDLQSVARQSLKMLILTAPGERIMAPDFGVGMRRYLFEQTIDKTTIKNKITDGVQSHLPEIEIVDLFIKRENMETTPEIHTVRMSIYYRLLADNSMDAIEINYQ